jgi:hydroxymethylbilane synthase
VGGAVQRQSGSGVGKAKMSTSISHPIRIGTRGSDLALWQARAVRNALQRAHDLPDEALEIAVIRTTGDRITDRALLEAGGKGLFTKEIEEALLDGSIHLAVHSAKDMPTRLPDELTLAAYLERADIRDALIAGSVARFDDLPDGAVLGTASLRRAALVRRLRPDIRTELIRGNVPTRLRRIEDGDFDATLLASAGLSRLGLDDRITELLDTERFPPACGQGAVTVECRADDDAVLELLSAIDHAPTRQAVCCERAFLDVLDGSCRTPIAGLAEVDGSALSLSGLVLAPDGSESHDEQATGPAADAETIGREAGLALRGRLPAALLDVLGLA